MAPRKLAGDVVKDVGRRIRLLRTSRPGPPLTQAELAGRAEVSVSFLSMLERGERSPQLPTLARLAEALEVPLAELFGFDADPSRIENLYRPLVDYCRRRALTRRDVERLVALAKIVFGETPSRRLGQNG